MSTRFETIAGSARPNLYAIFGEGVTVTQGEDEIEIDEAILAFPANRMREADSIAIWAEYGEWTVRTADLEGITPERGDEIETEDGRVWRVASPEGMPVYEFVDPEHKEIHIYCKLKEV